MAYGNLTNWPVGTALDYIYRPAFLKAYFTNNEFLGMHINGKPVFPQLPVGDSSYRWKVQSGGTTAAVFTEGASMPVPSNSTYINAYVAYTYYWSWVRISGHVRDTVKNAQYQGMNLIENEFLTAIEDIRDLANTSMMGASYDGLLAGISATTTYAGNARGSIPYWQSTATNHNGVLTRAGLLNAHETNRDNDKGGNTQLILSPHNQITNYIQLTGEPNAQNSSVQVQLGIIGDGQFDLAPRYNMCSFGGAPWVGLPDMTDTVICGLDLSPTPQGPNWGYSTRREFEVSEPIKVGDSHVFEISHAGSLIVHNPKVNWKLYDVTA